MHDVVELDLEHQLDIESTFVQQVNHLLERLQHYFLLAIFQTEKILFDRMISFMNTYMSIIWKTCIMGIFTPCYFILLSTFNMTCDSCFFTTCNVDFSWLNRYFNKFILLTIFSTILIILIITCC
jgi:hypothetical protein